MADTCIDQGPVDHIKRTEQDLIVKGYKRVDVVEPKSLKPGEYVISTYGGTETRFEGPGGATISWKPLPEDSC
ncbi:MAG: hypothetical protein ACREQZ_16165 [Woeseiaceae bacterium]